MTRRSSGSATLPIVVRHADVPALQASVAAHVARLVTARTEAGGTCRLGLAGGSTPRGVHLALARLPVDWARVEIVFGDERAVPPDDSQSNFRMACETLLDLLPVAPRAVYRIQGELAPEDAASAYEATLGDTPIDVVMLGMGDDGHVASLFPDTPDPDPARRVVATTSPLAPFARVSLTYRTIAEAGAVVLVVAGASKAARLAEVRGQLERGEATLPAARIAQRAGPLYWYIDAAAGAALT